MEVKVKINDINQLLAEIAGLKIEVEQWRDKAEQRQRLLEGRARGSANEPEVVENALRDLIDASKQREKALWEMDTAFKLIKEHHANATAAAQVPPQ